MSTAPEPLDLDAIRARADVATEGPWHQFSPDEESGQETTEVCTADQRTLLHVLLGDQDTREEYPQAAADARFIAAARTDVPALLDEIERRRTELRDKGNDLLDVRGLLSPNGGDSVLPAGFDISEQVAPAVEWLIDEVRRLRAVADAAVAWAQEIRQPGRGKFDDLQPWSQLTALLVAVDALTDLGDAL